MHVFTLKVPLCSFPGLPLGFDPSIAVVWWAACSALLPGRFQVLAAQRGKGGAVLWRSCQHFKNTAPATTAGWLRGEQNGAGQKSKVAKVSETASLFPAGRALEIYPNVQWLGAHTRSGSEWVFSPTVSPGLQHCREPCLTQLLGAFNKQILCRGKGCMCFALQQVGC